MLQLIGNFSQLTKPVRVQVLPSKIFMCGGLINEPSSDYTTVRDCLYNYIKTKDTDLFEKIVLAEDIKKWLQDGEYTNLLDLEKDLAGLVSAIPLIVESPGSIAELGSFIYMEEVAKKLLIIISQNDAETQSFINLGTINKFKSLKQGNDDRVFIYPWVRNHQGLIQKSKLLNLADLMYEAIKEFHNNQSDTEKFDENPSHIILLICDIVDVFYVSKLNEIEFSLHTILKQKIDRKTIQKYILIAYKLGLLAKTSIGNSKDTYYFSTKPEDDGFIEYNYVGSKYSKGRVRWKSRFRNHVIKNDQRKVRARQYYLESQNNA